MLTCRLRLTLRPQKTLDPAASTASMQLHGRRDGQLRRRTPDLDLRRSVAGLLLPIKHGLFRQFGATCP